MTDDAAFDRWLETMPAGKRWKVERQIKALLSYCPNLDDSHTFDDLRCIAEHLGGTLTDAPDGGVATCPK